MKKLTHITIDKYFEVIHPTYNFYKITPLKSLRNYNSDRILNIVARMYKTLTERIVRENKKYFFNVPTKVAYYIYMEKGRIEFYFIIPDDYKSLLVEKVSDVWKGVTCEQVDSIPFFGCGETVKYAMKYAKNDALSLATDKRNNVLLTSIASTLSVMEEGDKVGVIYNFMPTTQKYWRADYDHCMKKYQDGYPLDKDKTDAKFLIKMMFRLVGSVLEFAFEVLGNFSGEKVKFDTDYLSKLDLQSETKKKRLSDVIDTQIVVISESKNKQRANANGIAVCESFRAIESDNYLKYGKINNKLCITDYNFKTDVMKTSPQEGQNYLSLPAKSLIEEHGIDCIDVFESAVPKELQSGVVNLGESTYRGNITNVYLCNHIELRNLALCVTGSNRSGKTTLLSNIISNYIDNGECVFIPDFCGNCELTNHLISLFGDKVLAIDCSDLDNLQGLGYNEVNSNETNVFKVYLNAKMQATQLITLLNCVNDEDRTLKAKMDRYLECASLVVFINGGSIKDVFSVLQNHILRAGFISDIPFTQKENLSEYIDGLRELDEINKDGNVVGTRFNLISGIIDRLNALKKNSYIELMLKKSCKNNINLLEEIQKPQIISIKMPESMFVTSTEKDIFTTYMFSKLWLSLQLRKNDIPRDQHTKVNIIIDEIYQVENCQSLIASKLSQMPKFTAKLIVTCHYLDQIPALRTELRASNASYMLIQGSNVRNFDSLKAEFSNLNYEVSDLLNLKMFHSLNLLSYEGGYWAGVSHNPPPREKFTT